MKLFPLKKSTKIPKSILKNYLHIHHYSTITGTFNGLEQEKKTWKRLHCAVYLSTISVLAFVENSFILEVNILRLWPQATVHLSMSSSCFWLTGNYMAVTSGRRGWIYVGQGLSAAQIVPGLQRKGDFLQITLLLLVNNTKDEQWATGLYCDLLLL